MTLTSLATPLILGTRDHIEIQDLELLNKIEDNKDDLVSINEFSKS